MCNDSIAREKKADVGTVEGVLVDYWNLFYRLLFRRYFHSALGIGGGLKPKVIVCYANLPEYEHNIGTFGVWV